MSNTSLFAATSFLEQPQLKLTHYFAPYTALTTVDSSAAN